MVVDLRVELALHDILLVVPIIRACPTAWGIYVVVLWFVLIIKPNFIFCWAL